MKQFLKYIGFVALIVIVSMSLLHVVYTRVYSKTLRNKFQYIMSLDPQEIDYVFLGSSRVANHIMTSEVVKETNGTAVNLGIEGSNLGDNLLEMKLLMAREVKIKKLFLQVDYLYQKTELSNIANQAALPYLQDPVVSDFLKPQMTNFNELYYIPFYRYMITDFALGFREFFFSVTGKKGRIDLKDGFVPRSDFGKLGKFEWPETIAKNNEAVAEFQAICKQHNIELILFCSPVCSNATGKNYTAGLKKKLPGFIDYSTALGDENFVNCGHLSGEGAKKFTQLLIKDCITQK